MSDKQGEHTSSNSSITSIGTAKANIAAYEARIKKMMKIPMMPIVDTRGKKRRTSKLTNRKKKFDSLKTQSGTLPKSQTGTPALSQSAVNSDASILLSAQSNMLENAKTDENSISSSTLFSIYPKDPLDNLLDKESKDLVKSVFGLPKRVVKVNQYEIEFQPPHSALNVTPPSDGWGPFHFDLEALKKRLDPSGNNLASRGTFEALSEFRTAPTELAFPYGQTIPTTPSQFQPSISLHDELYFYPETAEEEGEDTLTEQDRYTHDWWRYVREEPPPSFLPSRPDPMLAYLAFEYPRSNAGIELSAGEPVSPPKTDIESCRFMFSWKNIMLAADNIPEPLFCEAMVVDVVRRCRISETFRFNLDPKTPEDLASCIFSVHKPRPSHFLVIKVNRVLTGDASVFENFYTKENVSAKEMTKLMNALGNSQKYLKDFTQGFAFGWIPLFVKKDAKPSKARSLSPTYARRSPKSQSKSRRNSNGHSPRGWTGGWSWRRRRSSAESESHNFRSLQNLGDDLKVRDQHSKTHELSNPGTRRGRSVPPAESPRKRRRTSSIWENTEAVSFTGEGKKTIELHIPSRPDEVCLEWLCDTILSSQGKKKKSNGIKSTRAVLICTGRVLPRTLKGAFAYLHRREKAILDTNGALLLPPSDDDIAPRTRQGTYVRENRYSVCSSVSTQIVGQMPVVEGRESTDSVRSPPQKGKLSELKKRRKKHVRAETMASFGEQDLGLTPERMISSSGALPASQKKVSPNDGGEKSEDVKQKETTVEDEKTEDKTKETTADNKKEKGKKPDSKKDNEAAKNDNDNTTQAETMVMFDASEAQSIAMNPDIMIPREKTARSVDTADITQITPVCHANRGMESPAPSGDLTKMRRGTVEVDEKAKPTPNPIEAVAENPKSTPNPAEAVAEKPKSTPNPAEVVDEKPNLTQNTTEVATEKPTSTPVEAQTSPNLSEAKKETKNEDSVSSTPTTFNSPMISRNISDTKSEPGARVFLFKEKARSSKQLLKESGASPVSDLTPRREWKISSKLEDPPRYTPSPTWGGRKKAIEEEKEKTEEEDGNITSDLIAEMAELPVFGVPPGPSVPATRFENVLYIYPQLLTISSHRNLTVVTELCDRDSPDSKGLPVIWGVPGSPMKTSHVSPMTYHLKKPRFFDEVKIALPTHLLASHHLRFTFYNISLKKLKKGFTNSSLDKLQNILGFAVLPLMRQGRFLDEAYSLRVYKQLKDGYILDSDKKRLQKDPNVTKDIFYLQTNYLSTLYTNSPHISKFFVAMEELSLPPSLRRTQKSSRANESSTSLNNEEGPDMALHTRLTVAAQRDLNSQKILREEMGKLKSMYKSCLYSGMVMKKGHISSWMNRWFVMREEQSRAGTYEIIYFTDSSSVGSEEARTVRVLFENCGAKIIEDKKARKDKGLIPFELHFAQTGSSIQLGVSSKAELRTWKEVLTHTNLARLSGFEAIASVADAAPKTLARFLPVVFRLIFRTLCYTSETNTRVALFKTLLRIFHTIQKKYPRVSKNSQDKKTEGETKTKDSTSTKEPRFKKFIRKEKKNSKKTRSLLLEQFAQFHFRDYAKEEAVSRDLEKKKEREKFPLWTYQAICTAWSELTDRRSIGSASQFSWLLLKIFYKSMVFHKNHAEDGKKTFFPKETLKTLHVLLKSIAKTVASKSRGQMDIDRAFTLNRSVGIFLRDCYQILDRRVVTDLLATYLQGISTQKTKIASVGPSYLDDAARTVERKCELLYILSTHPIFPGLLAPVAFSDAERSCLHSLALEARIDSDTKQHTRITTLHRKLSPSISKKLKIPKVPQIPPNIDENQEMNIKESKSKEAEDDSANPGIVLASAGPQRGHFLPRWLAAELNCALHRRNIMAPTQHKSLAPLESLAALSRSLIFSHADTAKEEILGSKASALLAQSFLPILKVLWERCDALSTMKTTRALKDLLIIFIYVLRTVPPSWIRKSIEKKGSHLYVPEKKRRDWLKSMLSLASLTVSELAHNPALPTNILQPENDDNLEESSQLGVSNEDSKETEISNDEEDENLAMLVAAGLLPAPKKKEDATKHFIIREDTNSLAKFSRIFFGEACHNIIDMLTNILIPLADKTLREDTESDEEDSSPQYAVISFLFSMLKANTASRVRRRVCMTISWLLKKYETNFVLTNVPHPSVPSKTPLISKRVEWERNLRYFWYQLLRQASCPGILPRDAISVLYQMCHVTHRKYGTSTPFMKAAIEGFGDVLEKMLKLRGTLNYLKSNDKRNANPFGTPRTPARNLIKTIREDEEEKRKENVDLEKTVSADQKIAGIDLAAAADAAGPETPPSVSQNNSSHNISHTQSADGETIRPSREAKASARNPRRTLSTGVLEDAKSKRDEKKKISPLEGLKSALERVIFTAVATAEKDARAATVDPSYLSASAQVVEVFGRMVRVLSLLKSPFRVSLATHALKEMTAWRYAAIADALSVSPDLHNYYLKLLKEFHESSGDLPEAGHVAEEIGKNAQRLLEIYQSSLEEKEWQKNFVENTRSASSLFEESGFVERALTCERRLAKYFCGVSDFRNAADAYNRIAVLVQKLDDYRVGKDIRSLGTFYRVEFLGTNALHRLKKTLPPMPSPENGGVWTENMHLHEGASKFIFREKQITRLAEVCARMKKLGSLVNCKVVLLRSKDQDLSPNELGIRITIVHPCVSEEKDLAKAETRKFYFEAPFTKSGKTQGSTKDQWRRKTICTVRARFPCRENCQPIVAETISDIAPIQNSILVVRKKVEDLRIKALPDENGKVKLNPLYQVLNGAVITQVNAGIKDVAISFLSKENVAEHSINEIRQLRDLLKKFIEGCRNALNVAREESSKTEKEQKASKSKQDLTQSSPDLNLNSILEEKFQELSTILNEYIDIATNYIKNPVAFGSEELKQEEKDTATMKQTDTERKEDMKVIDASVKREEDVKVTTDVETKEE